MCGIAGILNINHQTKQEIAIRLMTDRLAHRGPDAEGIYVHEKIALGHRRLSIIDLHESANQPMWDSSGRYVIVYNGEIYNYKDIKQQLTGYSFKTNSDSEVILAAYATWGAKCLSRFNGMFAFAIWDTVEQTLFMARDRVGKKPLYYALTDQHFVFSSELRSMLSSGLVKRQLDENHLSEYFMYQASIGDRTLIQNVKRLEAGHSAMVKHGKITISKYWGYHGISTSSDDYGTVKGKVKDLFLDAVRLRMVSDVPIGAFLSGGIDSSLVVACMAELSGDEPINTFTISFDEKEYDESAYAQQVATQYKTNHQRILIQPNEFLYSIEDILGAMDMPSGDGPNSYLVSRETRKAGIKVAMSGLGGDELFVGYNKFLIYHRVMKNKWILQFPVPVRKGIARMISMAGQNHQSAKLAFMLGIKKWELSTIYPLLRRAYSHDDSQRLLTHGNQKDFVTEALEETSKQISGMEYFSQATVGELEVYTRDVLLRDTDQMSMAHALEVRVPFFDYRLIEYVLSLPDKIKYPHSPKKLLVDALAPRIPKAISQRKKMGFTLPMEQWLKNELVAMAEEKISQLAGRNEFNEEAVMRKWKNFKQGDNRIVWSQIWKLIVLSDWMQKNNI